MAYRVRLFDRFDQQMSYQDLDTPAAAAAWANQAWEALLGERVRPPGDDEPAQPRHELTFIEADGDERSCTDEETREFSEALASG
jgi:hypothetical protein